MREIQSSIRDVAVLQEATEMILSSVDLDTVLGDWIRALREFSVEAIAVLGPDPFGSEDDRQVVAVYPPSMDGAAVALERKCEIAHGTLIARMADSLQV